MTIFMILNISIAILLAPVSTMTPEVRKQIETIYNNTDNFQRLIQHYNTFKNPIQEGRRHPCIQMYDKYRAFQDDLESKHVLDNVFTDDNDDTPIPFTLDGRNYLMTPALIRCRVQKADELDIVFYILLSSDSFAGRLQYYILYEYNKFQDRPAYVYSGVLKTELLKEAFEGFKFDKNKEMYEEIEKQEIQKQGICLDICKEHVSKYILKLSTVQDGFLNVRKSTLILSGEDQDVPGVLACKFYTESGAYSYLYFVINHVDDHVNPVKYLTRDMDQEGRIFNQVYNVNDTLTYVLDDSYV